MRNRRSKSSLCSYFVGKCYCDRFVTMASCVLLFFATVFLIFSVAMSYPIHASCKISWDFAAECKTINTALVNQMKAWSGPDGCKQGGEKCLYTVKSNTGTMLKGTHETPQKHYVDDLTFTFKQNGKQCQVLGYSTSETWYAVLDYSTNYCNMENLITGSGLNKTDGYKETTSDSVCTQYSSRNCEKY